MDAALSATYPGSAITYRTSSGGLANAALLDRRRVPLAMISDHEIPQPWYGRPPFKKPIKSMRLLFRPYVSESRFYVSHVLANNGWAKKYGIRTLADIGVKKPAMRLAINRPGNNDALVSLGIMTAGAGVTQQSVKEWGGTLVRAASREMVSLMLDRRIDLIAIGLNYNNPRIRELDKALDLIMLPVTEEVAKKVGAEWGGTHCRFKSSEYKFLATDSWGACIGMGVFVHENEDDVLVYNLMKAFFGRMDKIKASHRLLQKVMTQQTMAQGGFVPHHRAAVRYLKEQGLMK